jgi:hypothetical protein
MFDAFEVGCRTIGVNPATVQVTAAAALGLLIAAAALLASVIGAYRTAKVGLYLTRATWRWTFPARPPSPLCASVLRALAGPKLTLEPGRNVLAGPNFRASFKADADALESFEVRSVKKVPERCGNSSAAIEYSQDVLPLLVLKSERKLVEKASLAARKRVLQENADMAGCEAMDALAAGALPSCATTTGNGAKDWPNMARRTG